MWTTKICSKIKLEWHVMYFYARVPFSNKINSPLNTCCPTASPKMSTTVSRPGTTTLGSRKACWVRTASHSRLHYVRLLIVDIIYFFYVFSLSLNIAIHHLGSFITSVLCLKLQRAQKNCICRARLKDSVELVDVSAQIKFTHLSHFVQ